jgi:hypothetical protein
MNTLDDLIIKNKLPFPDLIKLDIQGSEIDALEGAKKSLDSAQFILTEFSLLPIQKNIPLLDELVIYMHNMGFKIFDIFGIYGRPLDGIPAKGEALFVKSKIESLSDFRWSSNSIWS